MGMTKANRISNSIKNRFAQTNIGKRSMTVGRYIEKKDFRINRTWKLLNGEWLINCGDVWLDEKDFNKLYPPPIIPNFNHDITNVDSKTSKWMYE